MGYIFAGIILLSFFYSILTGKTDILTTQIMESASDAVTLVISLTGMMCLWSGIMKIAEKADLIKIIRKLLSPITSRLFRGLNPSGAAMDAIVMNLSANLLGLGNAATPLGIKAMREMAKEQNCYQVASNEMIMFVVMNTASLQLIPTTTAFLRMQQGAKNPFDILPAVWLSSLTALAVGLTVVKLLGNRRRKKT